MEQAEPQILHNHGGLDLPFSMDNDSKLVAALQALRSHNEQVAKECDDVSREAVWVATSQLKARVAGCQELANTFCPEVLRVLKRSADQLMELKKQHIAEKQASNEMARKLTTWANRNQQSDIPGCHSTEMQRDAVKHGRFKFLQLPGSKVTSNTLSSNTAPTSAALKYWQVGIPASAGLPRSLSSAAGMDQHQLQKGLSSILFGKNRRASSSSTGTAAASPARMSDAAASWRSSDNGAASRCSSQRFSDTGAGRSGMAAGQAARSAAPAGQALLASLTAGEGPLSKSHSLLAKPGSQAEQLKGKSLEIVTEDEREGHDSPQPDADPGRSTSRQHSLMSTVRAELAGGGRTQSPIQSFSFGRRVDEESRSPDFLRASINSRQSSAVPALGPTPAASAAAGPLVRLSGALQSSRVDPFDAPEPQPQPFIEQMKLEDQAMQAEQMNNASGVLGALRRSLSMPARAVGMLQPSKSRSIRTPVVEASGVGPLTASAGAAVQQSMVLQQQKMLQQRPAASIGDDFELPTAGDDVEMLDLDASRAYAMGIHQMMQGMADALDGSENNSKLYTPRSAELNEQHSTGDLSCEAVEKVAAAAVAPAEQSEIQPAEEDIDSIQEPSLRPGLEQQLQQQLEQHRLEQQRLEQQRNQQQLLPPGPSAFSPEASRQDLTPPNEPPSTVQETVAVQTRCMRPSSSSADVRRQSQSAGAAALAGAPSATRGLPIMGQASMDILGRPPASLVQPERRPLSSSSSTKMRLTEVYQQTAGNLNPLSAGLSSMKRSSSHGTKPPRGPSIPSPRTSTQDDGQAGYVPAPGPLMAQRSSTMLHPRKPQPAVTASPRETRTRGWQSLGLPAGPFGPPANNIMDSSTYGTANKYAASWGLMDAASTAAAASGGQLSRQASAAGGLSRQQSAVMQGQLSRQNSAMSMKSPRSPFAQQQQMQQQPSARQQWQQGGAAGRYAGLASATPTSQSPRSDLGTPAHSNQQVNGAAAAARAKQAAAAAALQSRRLSDPGGQDSDEDDEDDGYDTAEEASASSSSYAGSTGVGRTPRSVGTGAQQKPPANTGPSPVPQPPAFLTSAQAAVAAQWSPNKHASAMAQAPAYARDALVAEVSDVIIDEGQGLQPTGLSYLSPRDATGRAIQTKQAGAAGATRNSQQQASSVAYAGGYSVYSPQAAPAGSFGSTKALGTAPARMAGRQQQQHQPVVTAVDLARRSSIRRTSSSSSGANAHYPTGHIPGYLSNEGARGAQPVAVSGAAASRASYVQQQQYPKQRTHSGYAPVGRKGYSDNRY